MPEEKTSNKNLTILGVILIIIVVSIGAAVMILVSPNAGKTEKQPSYTNSFSNITAEDAYALINNSNLTIYIIDDPNGCHCRFATVHIGNPPTFEAIKVDNLPNGIKSLYNTTNITIFYDDNGTGDSIKDCRKLVDHSYGAIYYLEGGLEAWQAKNYPVVRFS